MYLKITEQAQERLQNILMKAQQLYWIQMMALGNILKWVFALQILVFVYFFLIKNRENDYKLQLDSDIGDVYKRLFKMYMDEHMTLSLDPRLGVFTLESPSGSLDSHVQLVDLRPENSLE